MKGARSITRKLCVAAVFCMTTFAVHAQDYPTKRVNIIVPTGAGGLTDVLVRLLADRLQATSGQPVVVENKPSGLGVPASLEVAQSRPDGYTLLAANPAVVVVRPLLEPESPFTAEDFTPVAILGKLGSVLVVHESVPANSVQELIDLTKAKPGTITFASQGRGASGHMAAEQFRAVTGADLQHVPYRGAPAAMTALLGGHVSMLFDSARQDVAEQVQQGNVRALAVTSPTRLSFLPDVPTMTELGFPQVDGVFWVGLFAPAGTPPSVVEQLNQLSRDVFGSQEVQSRFAAQGMTFASETPDEAARFVGSELARWGEVIRATGLLERGE